MSMFGKARSAADEILRGFIADYGMGHDDNQKMMHRIRDLEGKQAEAPKMVSMATTYPTAYRVRDFMGKATPAGTQARQEMNMGLMPTGLGKGGQALGTVAADLTQDRTRRFWWLLNAAQATGEVINESTLAWANKASKLAPDLYGKHTVTNQLDKTGATPLRPAAKAQAIAQGAAYLDDNGELKPARGYSVEGKGDEAAFVRRNFEPGFVQSLAIPTGIAINSGLGLLTPTGGYEGYMAAIPSEEDMTKTENILGEVALKYIMGRTGNLLPYDEFVKVRPDVSPEEYGRYKGFKYDKDEDWNPLDGDLTLLAGALKGTTEGIHGPEIQFLGRSLPVTTGLVPYLSALAGGASGVMTKRPIRQGFLRGMGGLAAGTAAGSILEEGRRRADILDMA